MLFPVVFGILTLQAQLGGGIPDESREPMSIRSQAVAKCPIEVSGQAWVGKRTVKGGAIKLRDLTGAGVLAASGIIRFQFANGRYYDEVWKSPARATPYSAATMVPEDKEFPSALTAPIKIEGQVLGVYFANGESCGETGAILKQRHAQVIDNSRQDSLEALALALALDKAQFEKQVRAGLLKSGPYERETVASSNIMLRNRLIAADGSLVPEYKEWIRQWSASFKSAKPLHPTQSSRRHGH